MDFPMSGGCKWVTDKAARKTYLEKAVEVQENLDEKFEKYRKIAEEELVKLTKENALEEVTANIGKIQRWVDRLYKETRNLSKFKQKRDRMETEIYHYYRHNSDISEKMKYDSTAMKYVEANECYLALKDIVANAAALVEFIEGVTRNMRDRNFAIKNIIEIWKIEVGEL